MKLLIRTVPTLVLVACASNAPEPEPPRASAPVVAPRGDAIDLRSFDGHHMTVEEFVRALQSRSGLNFTYDAETASVMAGSIVRVEAARPIPRGEFDAYVAAVMRSFGLESKRIGRESLGVIAIQRRAI